MLQTFHTLGVRSQTWERRCDVVKKKKSSAFFGRAFLDFFGGVNYPRLRIAWHFTFVNWPGHRVAQTCEFVLMGGYVWSFPINAVLCGSFDWRPTQMAEPNNTAHHYRDAGCHFCDGRVWNHNDDNKVIAQSVVQANSKSNCEFQPPAVKEGDSLPHSYFHAFKELWADDGFQSGAKLTPELVSIH